MKTAVNDIWQAVQEKVPLEQLYFLDHCFRAYSSKAHIFNVMTDIELLAHLCPPPKKILDFGCGIGLQTYLLSQRGFDVCGLDTIEDKSIDGILKADADKYRRSREDSIAFVWEIIKKKVPASFQFYNGRDIPFPEDHFDIVFAYAVVEHIPLCEIPAIFEQIFRITKPGGLLCIFQLPRRLSYTEFIARKFNMQAHDYLWSEKDITALLQRAGFMVKFVEKADMLMNHPYKIVNPIFPMYRFLNRLLLHTPLSRFAHHLTVLSAKSLAQ